MRPDVWRLLLGYAPPNSDGKEGVLRRKRLEDLECLSQYYDIADTERSDDEINMLCQITVDYCPCTVPDVSFFQEPQVKKSLEHILYTWLNIYCSVPVAFICQVICESEGKEEMNAPVVSN
ncbi:uncharacterized protein LOC112034048 [Quercus suber]|uniref:uncharacterized protein LOC112034048 n=1 Tax=Quercus suber TaxID=58331 RepID=UPI0032DF4767